MAPPNKKGNRGGGEEDFTKTAEALKKRTAQRKEMVGAEKAYQETLAETVGSEDAATIAAEKAKRARTEAAEAAERQRKVTGGHVGATELDTAAIEANTRARERANAAKREQYLRDRIPLATRGAQDPSFSQAYALAQRSGGTVSQYRIRQELQGVGSRRAAALQAAIEGGFHAGTPGTTAPLTRERAARLMVERAEAELAEATRNRDKARKSAGVSDDERLALSEIRENAAKKRDAANLELESAQKEAAARAENAAAARREAENRARVFADEQIMRKGPLALPPAGGTGYAEPGTLALGGTRRPAGIVQEGGKVGGRLGGGDEGYDATYRVNKANQAAQAERAATATDKQAAAQKELARAELLRRSAQIDQWDAKAVANADAEARALTRAGVATGTFSQAMTRHGALTTEFIAAAARGQVTLRELGDQAIATAGKFAGWTAAGAALYTAVDAMHQLGQGAIQSSDGVAQLQRVIPGADRDKTMAAFGDLAREFNVPIETASDAVYRMGQRFHSLPEATEAARSALYSFKTGEVDVATSTENLLAIVNGFGLGASRLSDVYDQINQAQNTFGIRIGDTEAGLAKAGGAYKNAGGDLNYLLGLFVAISRATNRSGTEIGTGIARGVNEIRKPSHQQALKALGVDVDPDNFQTTLQSAARVAKRHPERSNQLAAGLLGNQYQRLLAPVLRDQDTLNEALRDTSPEASKGSAYRELQKVLSEFGEQLQKVGVNLQLIGNELARSGALIPFAGALKALNAMLELTGNLVGAFNHLPAPLRETLSVLGEVTIAMTALRRFGATDRFIGGPLGFLANPDKRLQTYAKRGLTDAKQQAFNELESSANQAHRAQFESTVARNQVTSFIKDPAYQAARSLPLDDERRMAMEARRAELEHQAQRYAQRADEALIRTVAAKEATVYSERKLKEVSDLHYTEVRGYLREDLTPIPRSMKTPSVAGVTTVGAGAAALGGAAAAEAEAAGVEKTLQTMHLGAALREIGGEHDLDKILAAPTNHGDSETATRITSQMQAATGAMRDRIESLGQIGEDITGSKLYGGLESAANRTTEITRGGLNRISRAGGAVKQVGHSLKQIGESLGPLDIAIMALVAGEFIDQGVEKLTRDVEENQQFIERYRGNTEKTREKLAEKAKEAQADQRGAGRFGSSQNLKDSAAYINDLVNPVRLFTKTLPAEIAGNYSNPFQKRSDTNKEIIEEEEIRRRQEEVNAEARKRHRPQPFLVAGQAIEAIEEDARLRKAGLITLAEFTKRMNDHATEVQRLVNPTKKQQAAANAVLSGALASSGNPKQYRESLKALSPEQLSAEAQATASQIQDFGLTRRLIRQSAAQYAEALSRFGGSNDSGAIQALSQARNAYYTNIVQTTTEELNTELPYASSEAAGEGMISKAAATINSSIVGNAQRRLNRDRQRVRDARAERTRARREARQGHSTPSIVSQDPMVGIGFGPRGAQNAAVDDTAARNDQLTKRVERANKAYNDAVADVDRDEKEVKAAKRARDKARKELKRNTAYEYRQGGRQVDSALAATQTAEPLEQANIMLRAARAQAADALKTFGVHSRQYRQSLTAVNQAKQQVAQAVLDSVQADNALLIANAGSDPMAQANAQVQAALNSLNAIDAANAKPGKNPFSKDQRKLAFAGVKTARTQREEAARSEAQQIAQLQSQIAAARAGDDPVVAARAAVRAAQTARRVARTRVEKLQALLDYITATNQLDSALKEIKDAKFELRQSKTDDPVDLAKGEVDDARRKVREAKGTAEKIRARANLNEKLRAKKNAVVDDKESTINFRLEMERITNEEAAKELDALSRIKGISKAKKRDLMLAAKRLRDEGKDDFNMDPGAIKLPTLYEVRRFVQGGAQGSGYVTNANQITVTVNGDTDLGELARVLESATGSSVGSIGRNAGMR